MTLYTDSSYREFYIFSDGDVYVSSYNGIFTLIHTDVMVAFWIEIIIYTQKYWWLRSPDVYNDYNAWDVRSSGEIDDGNDDDIGYSYGRRSPYTGDSGNAWQVFPDGDVDPSYSNVWYYPYGRLPR